LSLQGRSEASDRRYSRYKRTDQAERYCFVWLSGRKECVYCGKHPHFVRVGRHADAQVQVRGGEKGRYRRPRYRGQDRRSIQTCSLGYDVEVVSTRGPRTTRRNKMTHGSAKNLGFQTTERSLASLHTRSIQKFLTRRGLEGLRTKERKERLEYVRDWQQRDRETTARRKPCDRLQETSQQWPGQQSNSARHATRFVRARGVLTACWLVTIHIHKFLFYTIGVSSRTAAEMCVRMPISYTRG